MSTIAVSGIKHHPATDRYSFTVSYAVLAALWENPSADVSYCPVGDKSTISADSLPVLQAEHRRAQAFAHAIIRDRARAAQSGRV